MRTLKGQYSKKGLLEGFKLYFRSQHVQWTSMISKVKEKTKISPNLPGVLQWLFFILSRS